FPIPDILVSSSGARGERSRSGLDLRIEVRWRVDHPGSLVGFSLPAAFSLGAPDANRQRIAVSDLADHCGRSSSDTYTDRAAWVQRRTKLRYRADDLALGGGDLRVPGRGQT